MFDSIAGLPSFLLLSFGFMESFKLARLVLNKAERGTDLQLLLLLNLEDAFGVW